MVLPLTQTKLCATQRGVSGRLDTLYADIAVTSATAIDRLRAEGRDHEARNYVVALAANLILNAGWSWLFFKHQKLGASAIGAAVLAASSTDLARRTVGPIRGRGPR